MAFCSDCGSDIGAETFCPNCGKQMGEPAKAMQTNTSNQNIQENTSIQNTPLNPHIQSSFRPTQQFSGVSTPNAIFPPTRSYIKWMAMIIGTLVLGIFLFAYSIFLLFTSNSFGLIGFSMILIGFGGILQIIYQYHNFNDFKKLNQITHGYQLDRSMEPIVGLLLFFFVSPAAIFIKYNQLHEHLTRVHDEPNLSPSGTKVLITILAPAGILVFSFFSIFIGFDAFIVFNVIAIGVAIASPILFFYFENKWQNVLNNHILTHQTYVGD